MLKKILSYLVAESNTSAKEDSAGDQHGKVGGESVQDGSGDEENRGHLNGELAAEPLGEEGGGERGDYGGEVERRRKELQVLVVVLAVVIFLRPVLLLVHHREKLYQEVVHRRHSSCKIIKLICYKKSNIRSFRLNNLKVIIL